MASVTEASIKTIDDLLDKIFESDESLSFYRKKAESDFEWFLYWVFYNGERSLDECHRKEVIPAFQSVLGDFPKYVGTGRKKRLGKPKHDLSLFMLPRATYKSTILTQAGSLWLVIQNPDIRIGIGSWKEGVAQDFMRGVRTQMEENKVLRKMWPEIFYDNPRSESPKWSEEALQVFRFSREKEATFEAFGIETSPTGQHYDIIFCDDIVNEKNVNSLKVMRKVKSNVRLLHSIVMRGYPIIFIGTRYHFSDAYGEMEKDDGLGRGMFVFKRDCFEDDGCSPRFPKALPLEELDKLREAQGEYIFNCQYRLSPVNPEDIQFNIDNIQTYKKMPEGLSHYIGFDPTGGTSKEGDPATIIVMGQDKFGNIFWVDGYRMRISVTDQIERFISMGMQYKPNAARVEAIGPFAAAIEKPLKERMMAKGASFPYEIIKGYSRSITGGEKNEKPRLPITICPKIDAKKLHFPDVIRSRDERGRPVDLVQICLEEMRRYPFGDHDDLLDAMTLAIMAMPIITTSPDRSMSKRLGYVRQDEYGSAGASIYVAAGV